MSLRPYTVVVDRHTMVLAFIAVREIYGLQSTARSIAPKKDRRTGEVRGLPTYFDEECRRIYVEEARRAAETYVAQAEEIARSFIEWATDRRYLPGLYLLDFPYMPRANLVCLIAKPPQITHPELWRDRWIKPGGYINLGFVPVGKHRPRVAKVFHSLFYASAVMHWKRFWQFVEEHPKLSKLYRKNLSTYSPQWFARYNTINDIIRIAVGNAWLIFTYLAWEQGLIKEIVLPYHIAKNPLLHLDMVDPAELCSFKHVSRSEIAHITWRALLEIASEQAQKKS